MPLLRILPLSPLISLFFPSSSSLTLCLLAVINLGTLLIGIVFWFFLLISQKHLTLVFASPGVHKVPEKMRSLVASPFPFLMHKDWELLCLCTAVWPHPIASVDNYCLLGTSGT